MREVHCTLHQVYYKYRDKVRPVLLDVLIELLVPVGVFKTRHIYDMKSALSSCRDNFVHALLEHNGNLLDLLLMLCLHLFNLIKLKLLYLCLQVLYICEFI